MNNLIKLVFRKNIIFLFIIFLLDIVYVVYTNDIRNIEFNIYYTTYDLYLYGIIITQYIYFFSKYLQYYNLLTIFRNETHLKMIMKIYKDLILLTMFFTISFHLLFNIVLGILGVEQVNFYYILYTIFLQFLSYMILAQLFIIIFLKDFKVKFALIMLTALYFLCVLLNNSILDYFIVQTINLRLLLKALIMNFICAIIAINYKRRDSFIEK